MPNPLTPEQLETLRSVPALGTGTSNRLRLALALTGAKQTDVAEETGIPAPNLSGIVTGRQAGTHVETARKLANYFGCRIEDLFPGREASE